MMGVGIVVEAGDFPVTFAAIKGVSFGQRPVRVQAQRLQPLLSGGSFERSQHPARDADAAGGWRSPDALDFSGRFIHAFEPAAPNRVAIEPGDHKETGWRRHILDVGMVTRASVKAALETRRKLAEVRAEAEARVGGVRRFGCDL